MYRLLAQGELTSNLIARTIGGTPESWLRMQQALDLWTAEIKFKNNPALAPKAVAA